MKMFLSETMVFESITKKGILKTKKIDYEKILQNRYKKHDVDISIFPKDLSKNFDLYLLEAK